MSGVAEASGLIRKIAGPQPIGHNVKAVLRDLCAALPDFTPNRIKDIYQGRIGISVSSEEMDMLRAKKIEGEVADAKRKLKEALAILRRGETALRISDPDFHSDYFDRLGDVAGSTHSALDRRDDE